MVKWKLMCDLYKREVLYMKKILSLVVALAIVIGVALPILPTLYANAEGYTGVIDNGGSEEKPYPLVSGFDTATNTSDSTEAHSGSFSTKIVTSASGIDGSIMIESTDNYDKIPLNKEVYITFWAKADETAGFKGAIFSGNVYQTSTDGSNNKLDNYTSTYAIGSGSLQSKWEEFPKSWKQYYIKVQKPFINGFDAMYSYINMYGKGTLYIDDFDIVEISAGDADTTIIDNAGSEEMAYQFINGGDTATNSKESSVVHSGGFSTKIVTKGRGMNASIKIESTINYDKIPLNKEVYISFWAKADDTAGFLGAIASGNVYQTAADGSSNKLDNYTDTYAAGTGTSRSEWVEFSKEWTQYFIKVQKPFVEGYTGMYSFINIYGRGTFYIDDFDIIDPFGNNNSTDIIDNAGSEEAVYAIVNGAHTITTEQNSTEFHGGSFSTKIVTLGEGMDASIKIESTANYNKIPLNKEVYITFWAKADETAGFKGTMFSGNVYQTRADGSFNKLDNYTSTYAAGTGASSDKWEEFPKEWKQYFIKVQLPFIEGYMGMYSFINMYGKGTLYIDDFDIIDLNPGSGEGGGSDIDTDGAIIDNAGSELGALGETGTPTVHSSDEAHSGGYSTKISTNGSIKITSSANYNKIPLNKEVYITFWAKADEAVGYKGAIYTGNVYQTRDDGSFNKLDNHMLTFAAGSAATQEGWVDFDKEWKQYSMKVQSPFEEGYTGMYSFINFDGNGVLYLDDFDIVDLSAGNDEDAIIDNASCEIRPFGETGTPTEHTDKEAHSGKYSTKVSTTGSIKITSTTNYDKIPLGQDVFITFWAKADETVGYKGAMGSGNIYQVAADKSTLKLDGWTTAYAFGSTLSETDTHLWEEVSTEWTKYYIKVLHSFDIGYVSMYSFVNFVGEGILYIDDFDIETAGEGSGAENPLKVAASDDVIGARYYESITDASFHIAQKIVIKNLTSAFESGVCGYTVRDSLGGEISTGEFDVAVGPQSTTTYVIDCSSIAAYGTYTVDFSVTRPDGSKYDVGTINISRIKELAEVNASDMLGVNMHGGEVSEDKKDELRAKLKPLAAMGVNTVRTSFHWTDYEKEKGVYRFNDDLKNYFEVCAEFGMVVAPVLKESLQGGKGNPLYAGGDLSQKESVEGYGNFCAAFIEFMGDYAKYALISNEPNYCDVPAASYAEMLKSAYVKIKVVNPDVKVVGAEVSGWGEKFITEILELGAYDYMDALGIHPYVYPRAPEISDVMKNLENLAKLTASYSSNNKPLPLWCDEYGYFTSGTDNAYSPVSEEQQAVYMTRYTAMMAASGLVEMAMPYVAYDTYDNYDLSEGNYGIMRHNNSDKGGYSSKPAHLMLAGYMDAVSGRKFAEVFENEAGIYAYRYTAGDGKNVYMLWNNLNKMDCTVEISGGKVKLYDCFGNSEYVDMNDKSLGVQISQRPVYMILEDDAVITDIILGGEYTYEDDNDSGSSKDDYIYSEDEDYSDTEDEKKTETVRKKVRKKKVITVKKTKGTPGRINYLPIIIAACAVILVGGGLTVFFIIRKKKSKKDKQ